MADISAITEFQSIRSTPGTLFRDQVDVLLREAENLVYSDPDRAKLLAKEALQFAVESVDISGNARACYLLGCVEHACGHFDIALRYALEAQEHAKKIIDEGLRFKILILLSGIEIAHGRLGTALEMTMEAHQISEKLNDTDARSIALLNFGQLYRLSGQYDKSMESIRKSLSLQTLAVKDSQLAQVYRELGSLQCEMGDHPEALESLLKSLAIEKEIGNKLRISDISNNIGIVMKCLDRFEEAEKYFQQSLDVRMEVGDPYKVAMGIMHIGLMRFYSGKFSEAIDQYNQALEIVKKSGSQKGEAKIESNLADVYEKMNDYKTALEHTKRAHELHVQLTTISMEEKERRLIAQAETERIKQEAELDRIKSVELVKAQRMARVGSYSWDALNDVFTGSDEFYRLLEREKNNENCTLEKFLLRIKAADRNQVGKVFRSALEWNSIVDVVARAESNDRGRQRTFHILGEWIDNGGAGKKLVGTLQDITIQLEADEARREREKLEGMLEMAGAFSHEINQPMQVIVTAAELLLYRYPENSDVHKSVANILKAATRMTEITGRLMKTTTYKTKKYVGETRIIDTGDEL